MLKQLFSLFAYHKQDDPIAPLDQKLVFSLHKKNIPNSRQFKHAKLFFSTREKILILTGITLFITGLSLLSNQFINAHRIEIPARGGTYREALIGSPNTFNPLFSNRSSVDRTVSKLLFSSLVTYDEHAQLINDLAESITEDEKKTTYTITLRDNTQFHDGTPLTTQDIKFTVELIQNETIKSPLKGQLYNVKTNIINDKTIQLTLKEPFPQFTNLLTFGILPKHLWEHVDIQNIQTNELNKQPIGSGPFSFVSMNNDDHTGITTITLTRNEQYYNTPPFIENIELKAVSSEHQALELFLKQEVDGLAALTTNETERLSKRANQYKLSVPEYTGIFFNQITNESLKRQAVRDALSLTINKQKIVDEALSGNATIAHSPFVPGMHGYIEGTHESDTIKAEELLDNDNWEKIIEEDFINIELEDEREAFITLYKELNEDNEPSEEEVVQALSEKTKEIAATIDPLQPYFRKRNNTILKIKLTYVDTSDTKATAELIKEAWRSIGIHVVIEPIPAIALERDILASHRYEALLLGVVLGANSDPFPLWFDAGNTDRATLARFVDRNLDDLLESIRNTKDENKRTQLLEEFQTRIMEKKYAIILYNPTYQIAVVPRVGGINATHIVTPPDRFAGITHWYVKTTKKWKW